MSFTKRDELHWMTEFTIIMSVLFIIVQAIGDEKCFLFHHYQGRWDNTAAIWDIMFWLAVNSHYLHFCDYQ